MQRLDRALIELAERGDAIGPDLMLDRLDRALSAEPEPIVVALDLRRTDVQTIERPNTGDSGHPPSTPGSRTRLLAAAVVVAILGIGAGIGVVVTNGDETDDVTAAAQAETEAAKAVMAEFTEALDAADAEAAKALVVDRGLLGADFLGWLVAVDSTGITFNCAYGPGEVACDTSLGPDSFLTQLAGPEALRRFSATVEDGKLVDPQWPATPELLTAERAFRSWAEKAHPDRASLMFNNVGDGVVFSAEGGAARMGVLDEYLMIRNEQRTTTAFVNALRAGDAETARALVVSDSSVGPDFIGFMVALDTSRTTFDCTYQPGAVECDTTLGSAHFFEQINGAPVEGRFSATVSDGVLVDPRWPSTAEMRSAEAEFRRWAEEAQPELADVMFDNSVERVVFTEESGRTRMALLDGYLAAR